VSGISNVLSLACLGPLKGILTEVLLEYLNMVAPPLYIHYRHDQLSWLFRAHEMDRRLADEFLQSVATKVRSAYCERRRLWHLEHEGREVNWGKTTIPKYDGGTDVRGWTRPSVWTGVARFVLLHGLNPQDFVRAQFATQGPYPVEPTQLVVDASLNLYHRQRQREGDEIARLFEFQKQRLKQALSMLQFRNSMYEWNDVDLNRIALTNRLTAMSALFRHSIAGTLGYADLVDEFHDAALLQYLADRDDYDRVWGGLISEELRADAEDLKASIASATGL